MTRHFLRTYPGRPVEPPKNRNGLLTMLYTGAELLTEDDPARRALKQWLLNQPDDSVTPEALLREAVRLEDGDVQRGLERCWDVLRENWQDDKNRNAFPHILKLIDITGERESFDGNDPRDGKQRRARATTAGLRGLIFRGMKSTRGDNFSAWYHFFGTASYAFHGTANKSIVSPLLATRAAIFLEEKVLHNEFKDAQKRRINDVEGAKFGYQLAKNLMTYKTVDEFEKSEGGLRTEYLYDAPEKFGRKWQLQEGQTAHDFGTSLKSRNGPTVMEEVTAAKRALSKALQDPGADNLKELVSFVARGDDENRVALLTEWMTGAPENSQQKTLRKIAEALWQGQGGGVSSTPEAERSRDLKALRRAFSSLLEDINPQAEFLRDLPVPGDPRLNDLLVARHPLHTPEDWARISGLIEGGNTGSATQALLDRSEEWGDWPGREAFLVRALGTSGDGANDVQGSVLSRLEDLLPADRLRPFSEEHVAPLLESADVNTRYHASRALLNGMYQSGDVVDTSEPVYQRARQIYRVAADQRGSMRDSHPCLMALERLVPAVAGGGTVVGAIGGLAYTLLHDENPARTWSSDEDNPWRKDLYRLVDSYASQKELEDTVYKIYLGAFEVDPELQKRVTYYLPTSYRNVDRDTLARHFAKRAADIYWNDPNRKTSAAFTFVLLDRLNRESREWGGAILGVSRARPYLSK